MWAARGAFVSVLLSVLLLAPAAGAAGDIVVAAGHVTGFDGVQGDLCDELPFGGEYWAVVRVDLDDGSASFDVLGLYGVPCRTYSFPAGACGGTGKGLVECSTPWPAGAGHPGPGTRTMTLGADGQFAYLSRYLDPTRGWTNFNWWNGSLIRL